MKSIKEHRQTIDKAMIKHGIHTYNRSLEIDALVDTACELLAWAAKARAFLKEWESDFLSLRIPCGDKAIDDDCDFCDEKLANSLTVADLLAELPE